MQKVGSDFVFGGELRILHEYIVWISAVIGVRFPVIDP